MKIGDESEEIEWLKRRYVEQQEIIKQLQEDLKKDVTYHFSKGFDAGWEKAVQNCYKKEENNYRKFIIASITVQMDGNMWFAHFDDFKNLQVSPSGFGKTPQEAITKLYEDKR